MEGLPSFLESLELAQALRRGRWSYALVNASHIAGLALLFGSIAVLDVRILGRGREYEIRVLARQVLPVSIVGLVIALLSGFLLFMVNASEYLSQPVFFIKLGLVILGVANAVLLHASPQWRLADLGHVASPRLKLAAGLSLTFWLGAIICGRLLGFL